MELGWIVIMTLKLTKANLLRIKKTLLHLIQTNPFLSACIFVAVAIFLTVIIIKYVKSTA
jgi:hypothetical protein